MSKAPSDISLKRRLPPNFWSLSGILLAVTLVSTLILSPRIMVVHPAYRLGDVADRDIKAPSDFLVEDVQATSQQKQAARESVLTVYDYDDKLADALTRQVHKAFGMARSLCEPGRSAEDPSLPEAARQENTPEDCHQTIWRFKPEFEKLLGIPINDGAYKLLEKEKFSPDISETIAVILFDIMRSGVTANKELLLKNNEKGITLVTLSTGAETTVLDVKKFYGLDQAKAMVRAAGEPLLKNRDYSTANLIVDLTQRLAQPNITLNRSETENRRNAAESVVNATLYKIQRGEMLIREGERFTPIHLLKLEALKNQAGAAQQVKKGIGTALIILMMLTITYLIHLKFQRKLRYYENKNLVFISSVIVLFLVILQFSASLARELAPAAPVNIPPDSMFYGIPMAGGAMIICLFMGFNIAFPFAIVMALIGGIVFENSYELCLYFMLSGIMGAFWVQNAKKRKALIQAGVKTGLLSMAIATVIDIFLIDFSGFKLPWDWTFAFIGGVSAGIITTGLTPLMELAFGYTTDSTLQELANLDQPLLRRLMLEAPGTYHHSVLVGSLAEAGAAEIGANPLLARVSGYYHDIGKLKNPLYFIENQQGGKNIHNKLAPSMSCLILISHTKNGIELAREYKLGQSIQDAINQHHGTTLIGFFYEKAKKLEKEDQVVNIDNFRYPGPKPQTRETALVMLADVVEAASRTLDQPTPARIQGLVQQLFNKLFTDNQLDECPLTLKDLHNIARSFNKILNGIYHHRVEYPDNKTLPGEQKEKNGHTDRQPAETTPPAPAATADDSPSTIRRLGQS